MTWIVWGVSVSGAVYFVDSTRGSAPLTWTASVLDANLDRHRRRHP